MQGIYEIVNLHDGKATAYVGSAANIRRRWKEHRTALRHGWHFNVHLQHAWDRYGKEAFEWGVIEEVHDVANLIEREQFWLDKYFEMPDSVYNIARDATAPMLGRVPWNKGKHLSKETRRKLSEACSGWTHTEEAKRKIGEASRGRVVSEKTRRKMSKANRGQVPWTKGKVLPEATKRRIGEANAKPYPAFVHQETGEVIPAGMNLCKLCRERGLIRRGMRQVIAGARKSHKGWVLANPKEVNDGTTTEVSRH